MVGGHRTTETKPKIIAKEIELGKASETPMYPAVEPLTVLFFGIIRHVPEPAVLGTTLFLKR